MFDRMTAWVAASAEARAATVARGLQEKIAGLLPEDVHVAADEEGVRLAGRGLLRRLALDPGLRSLWQRLL